MILFISDIHGISNNLSKLELSKYDEIYFLGDLYGYYSSDENLNEFLKKYADKIICTIGNCDIPNDYTELGLIPNEVINFKKDNIHIYCTHGNKYREKYNSTFPDMDVLIYGHEHIPYIKKRDDRVYICVGSISAPRDYNGASYLEYENNKFTLKNIAGNIIDELILKK